MDNNDRVEQFLDALNAQNGVKWAATIGRDPLDTPEYKRRQHALNVYLAYAKSFFYRTLAKVGRWPKRYGDEN
jgi:hypothetical protein